MQVLESIVPFIYYRDDDDDNDVVHEVHDGSVA
jgi:hypothetical protein